MVEHVFEDAFAAKEEDVGVVGYYAVDEVEGDEGGALGFGFHWGGYVGDAEEAEHCLGGRKEERGDSS